MKPDPRSTYTQRLAERRLRSRPGERRHRSLGYWRLAAVACGVAIVGMALFQRFVSVLWAAIPAGCLRRPGGGARAPAAVSGTAGGARRGSSNAGWRVWTGAGRGAGEPGDRYLDPAHPYARDLDLFGKGSLFELLSTARTHVGEDTLARWLLSPAAPPTVRARQEAVEELRPRVDLREELAILAEEARTGVDPVALAAWGEAPALLGPGRRTNRRAGFDGSGPPRPRPRF